MHFTIDIPIDFSDPLTQVIAGIVVAFLFYVGTLLLVFSASWFDRDRSSPREQSNSTALAVRKRDVAEVDVTYVRRETTTVTRTYYSDD